jgi:hypothetical protein
MIIERPQYVEQLDVAMHNGLVKIITGLRRCGKSFLLSTLFSEHLKNKGIASDNILYISMESLRNRQLKDPVKMLSHIEDFCSSNSAMHYVIIDEVQMVDDFVDLLNSLLLIKNLDVYVTGSNSRFLSSDIATEFRGRSYEIHLYPLSFGEYFNFVGGDFSTAWEVYSMHGGLPLLVSMPEAEKESYLKQLVNTVYLRDIIERNHLENKSELKELMKVMASSIGSLTNVGNISNTFKSKGRQSISDNTIAKYIKYLEESFVLEKSIRYDIRGKQYIGALAKYYFQDIGMCNALLSFRQVDKGHIMENVIYNELRMRGFSVDVGQVSLRQNGERLGVEVDFVANQGSRRYYIQSSYQMMDEEKAMQEKRPLKNIGDSFKKIVIVSDQNSIRYDDDGIATMGLQQFLTDRNSLER